MTQHDENLHPESSNPPREGTDPQREWPSPQGEPSGGGDGAEEHPSAPDPSSASTEGRPADSRDGGDGEGAPLSEREPSSSHPEDAAEETGPPAPAEPAPGDEAAAEADATPQTSAASEEASEGAPTEAGAELPGSEWGYIDDDGRVWVKQTPRMDARVIGKAKGRDPQVTFKFFVDRFKKLEALTNTLEEQIRDTQNKGRFSERVTRLIERVRTAQALGDFESLLARLEALRDLVFAFQADVRQRKEQLCEQAEALKDSTEWKATADRLKELQSEWKRLGSASRGDDDRLWKRFRGALDHFFARRDEDRSRRRAEREQAKAAKVELCEEAEKLTESTDWGATAKRQEELMEAWKAAGWCGKVEEERLWKRFRAARNQFFERRREAQKEIKHQLEDNRARKDGLCESAEALIDADNALDACEQAKLLQAEWKEIGPVPRAVSKPQWERFRAALDKIFERGRNERRRDRDRRQQVRQEGVSRKREKAERLRESITRDQGHLERWRHAAEGLGEEGGGLREELEQKIASVEQQLAEKRRSLEQLEREIRKEADG